MKLKDRFINYDFESEFVSFETGPDALIVRGTNKNTEPFLMRNRLHDGIRTGIRIPTVIMKAYGIERNAILPSCRYGKDGVKFFLKRTMEPMNLERSILTNAKRVSMKKSVFLGTVKTHNGFILGDDIEALKKSTKLHFEGAKIVINRHSGAWISISPVRKNSKVYSLWDIKETYGQRLQYYPFQTLTYRTDYLEGIMIPDWFWYNQFHRDIEEFKAYRCGNRIFFVPDMVDELTQRGFDFTKDAPALVEICDNCPDQLNTLKGFVGTINKVEGTMGSLIGDIAARTSKLNTVAMLDEQLTKAFREGDIDEINRISKLIENL